MKTMKYKATFFIIAMAFLLTACQLGEYFNPTNILTPANIIENEIAPTKTDISAVNADPATIPNPDQTPQPVGTNPIFSWAGGTVGADKDISYLADLEIVAADTNAVWGGPNSIETAAGKYDFSALDNMLNPLRTAGITDICLSIYLQNPLYDVSGGNFTNPGQWTAYGNFLTALANRYPEVNCYQAPREANVFQLQATPEEYAEIIIFTGGIIKAVNPKAMIVLAALPYDLRIKDGRENFLRETIQYLPSDKKYFDAIDIHLHVGYWKSTGPDGVASAFTFYKNQLSGIYADSKIFFETSAYSGKPQDNNYDYPAQTEQDQAEDLAARLNKLAELGAYRVNLEGGIWQRPYFLFTEAGNAGHLYFFEHTGLIWDCAVDKDTDTGPCQTGTKKKAYHALKEWISSH